MPNFIDYLNSHSFFTKALTFLIKKSLFPKDLRKISDLKRNISQKNYLEIEIIHITFFNDQAQIV